jgi:hypothetical protein
VESAFNNKDLTEEKWFVEGNMTDLGLGETEHRFMMKSNYIIPEFTDK